MEVLNNIRKLKLLFEHECEGKVVFSEYDAERLLKLLENRNDNSPGVQMTPEFCNLICHSLQHLNKFSNEFKVFLIDILSTHIKNELLYTKMEMQCIDVMSIIIRFLGNLNDDPSPNKLHLASIKLATAHLQHCSRLQKIIQHKVWKIILYPNVHRKWKPISNAAYDFMAKLAWRLDELNLETELLEVLAYVVEPIIASGYLHVSVIDIETDAKLCDQIFPSLNTLLAILTSIDDNGPVNIVLPLLKDYFLMDYKLFDIGNATKNSALLRLLNVCLLRYAYGNLRYLLINNKTDEFCNKMAIFHRNYLMQGILRRDVFTIIDFVVQANIIWSEIEKTHKNQCDRPFVFERNGQKLEFPLQIIMHMSVPITAYYLTHQLSKKQELNHLIDVLDGFIVKMGQSIADYIYSCCYKFAELIRESDVVFGKKVAIAALKELLRLKGHINESQAGFLFQSLYYLLEIFITRDGAEELVVNENPMNLNDQRLLSHLLDAMKMLLKEHKISWYENVEIVSIQADLMNLLKHNYLTPKHVVQVLDLIDICVKKFLSPNMSLLVDSKSTQDSTLNEIGEVMKSYMLQDDWEVRDSALNLLNTCTEIAFIKYVPLQNVIRKNGLLILAAKAALTDPEFYSQSTALKCLTAATKINCIWQDVVADNSNICLQVLHILRNHSEGMVRKEAANVLTGVYTNQKLNQQFQTTLYEVMTTASIDDFHWEVQLAALNFWKRAIHNHLTYRGMLDGKFPAVTFSKERRKIIVLDDKEIQRQLVLMMNELSAVGCLTALLECMNKLHHRDVKEHAYSIAQELIDILNKYRFVEVIPSLMTSRETTNFVEEDRKMVLDLPSPKSEDERDKVIDDILSIDQSELIINLYDSSCKINRDEMDIDIVFSRRRVLVDPNKFFETFQSDVFSVILEQRENSSSYDPTTLEGLLDEILDKYNCTTIT